MNRSFKAGLWAATAGLAVLFATASTPVSAKELVVASWGDPMRAAWNRSQNPKFEKVTGAKLVWTEGNSSQSLGKLKAAAAKPEHDIAMFDDGPFYQAHELGLCEKVDWSKIPNAKETIPVTRKHDHGVMFAIVGSGLWYNKDIFAQKKWTPPTSWADVLKPEYRKRIATHNISNSNGLMTMLAFNDLFGGKTPENMDPGFAKMKEFAQHVVAFDMFGDTPTLIQQEAVVMGVWSSDRVFNLKNVGGVPIEFVYPKEGVYGWLEAACIVKGRPKESQDLAYAYINQLLSKEEQENTAKYMGFLPLHPAVKGYGTEAELKAVKFVDWSKINPNRPAWTERWAKEVERK